MRPDRNTLAALSLVSLELTIFATAVHHIFRMGLELVPASLIALALPLGLMAAYRRWQKPAWAWAYTVYAGLIFLWFGFFDGFLDHVFKALGLDNVTFLPGSDAEVVATVFQLWSPEASNIFYEGTGVLTTLFGVVAVVLAARFLLAERAGWKPALA